MNDPIKQAILQHAIKLNAKAGTFAFDNRDLFLRGDARTLVWDAALKILDKITHLNADVIVTRGMGGIPLALAMATFCHMHVLIVRDVRKPGGFRRLIEGPPPEDIPAGTRAVLIDDLMNAGNTYRKVQRALQIEGYDVQLVGAAVLVDFWHGSRTLRATGVPVEALYRRHALGLSRKDSENAIALKVAWHVPHLNKDRGLDIKSWPRVKDNSLYVGDDAGNFHCFSTETGHRVWTHVSENPQWKGNVCVPAFHSGNVIISSYDGTVRALGLASGHAEWTTKVDKNLHSSPCIAGDRIYIGTEYDKHGGNNPREWAGRGDIVALDARNGYELWRTKTDGMVPGSPEYDPETNTVVCGSNDFHLYILDADTGTVVARVKTIGEVKGRPLLRHNRIVTLSVKGCLQCFDMTGALRWQREVGAATHPWVLGIDKFIYITNSRGMGMCIDYDGKIQWLVKFRGPVAWGFSTLGARLSALTTSGYLVTVDPVTGQKLSNNVLSELPGMKGMRAFQPIWQKGGKLFIATNNRGLLALDHDVLV